MPLDEIQGEFDIVGSCVDEPKPTDWGSADIFGSDAKAEPRFLHATPVQNQSLFPSTKYACTIFALTHGTNELDKLERMANEMDFDPRQASSFVQGAADAGWFRPTSGAKMQDAVQHFRDSLKLISGWSVCRTFDECAQAISRGNPIFTGSNRADWKKTNETKEFHPSPSSYGHAFCIDGYDGECLVARNSYGTKFGDNGRFRISRESFGFLYTCLELFDKKNEELISIHRKKMSQAKRNVAKDLGIWNGNEQDKPVTRGEAAEMVLNALAKVDPTVMEKVSVELAK